MADSKRLSLGGRVATPRLPTGLSQDQMLARMLGAHVRLQTANPPRTLNGYIFALAPNTPTLTLMPTPIPNFATTAAAAAAIGASSSGTSTPVPPAPIAYTTVSLASILSFTVLELAPLAASSASGTSPPTHPSARNPAAASPAAAAASSLALPTLDAHAAGQRAATAVNKLQAAEARRGRGVPREAQQLFDALHRTLPVAWDGPRIVVLGSVVIAAPYQAADVRAVRKGGSSQEVARVKKVVDSERKKIAAAAAAAAPSRATPEPKKGG